MADECNIKVVCRVRPLNSSEERAGSKFVLKFPTDETATVGVCLFSVFPRMLQQIISLSRMLHSKVALEKQTGSARGVK